MNTSQGPAALQRPGWLTPQKTSALGPHPGPGRPRQAQSPQGIGGLKVAPWGRCCLSFLGNLTNVRRRCLMMVRWEPSPSPSPCQEGGRWTEVETMSRRTALRAVGLLSQFAGLGSGGLWGLGDPPRISHLPQLTVSISQDQNLWPALHCQDHSLQPHEADYIHLKVKPPGPLSEDIREGTFPPQGVLDCTAHS